MNIKPISSPVVASTTGERDGARRSAPSPRRLPAPLSLLVLANAVSLIGNVVMTVAIPWLVLTTTGSAAAAGVAVFASVGGAAAGGLAAGRIVDAIGPVRTSSAADLISGLAVAPLPILLALDALEIRHVVLLAIVGSLADSAGSSARQSLVPVAAASDGHGRERANALFTSAEHVGYLVGAPIAGLHVAGFGVGGALWVTVASFALAASVVAGLVRLPRSRAVALRAERAGLREAITFIWADPVLRALFLFPTAAVLLVGPLVPLVLPVLARETYGDPVVLGVMVASYGAGGLLGAAGYGMFGSRVPRRRLYNAVFVVWPCTYAAITLVPYPPLTLAMLLTLGAAAGSLVPLQATIRQERSPAHLLPRVVGLSTGSVPVATPIGVVVTGLLIDGLGLHQTLLLTTAGAALIGATVLTSKSTEHFDENEATQSPSTVLTVPVTGRTWMTSRRDSRTAVRPPPGLRARMLRPCPSPSASCSLLMPVDDVRRRVVKRSVAFFLVIFVGANFLLLVVGPLVIVAFDPPVAVVAWGLGILIGLGAVVLAIIVGRRTRVERERVMRDADQAPNNGDGP